MPIKLFGKFHSDESSSLLSGTTTTTTIENNKTITTTTAKWMFQIPQQLIKKCNLFLSIRLISLMLWAVCDVCRVCESVFVMCTGSVSVCVWASTDHALNWRNSSCWRCRDDFSHFDCAQTGVFVFTRTRADPATHNRAHSTKHKTQHFYIFNLLGWLFSNTQKRSTTWWIRSRKMLLFFFLLSGWKTITRDFYIKSAL